MARGNATQLGLGPGYLYFGPIGTIEPADLATAWAAVSAAWTAIGYCTDISTEILTRRGWLTHDQVRDGDECLGISAEDGLARWQPILAMHRFPAMPRTMIRMTGSGHDSLTTPNHRWLVDRRPADPPHLVTGRKGGRRGRLFTTTDSFHWADRIPCAAPVTNLPGEPKYADALVELVAWWVTEGSKPRNGGMRIYQSETANPQHCAGIRAALGALFGPARPDMADDTPSRPDKARRGRIMEPAWREGQHRGCQVFYLNKPAGDLILEHAPGKIIQPGFVTALTRAQLLLLLGTAIKGDGWHGVTLSQRERAYLDPLQMAASLAGLRTTLRDIPNRGRPNWVLRIITSTEVNPRRRCDRAEVAYNGLIWCPKTPTSTWLARRHGMVYFTGNTEDGNEFNYNPSTSPVDVAEELDHIQVVTTGRDSSVKFAMSQITSTNMKLAMNGGVLTTGTGIVTYEPPDLGSETRIMLGFESEDHTERWVFRQCFQTGTVTLGRHKGANNAAIAVEFSLEKPATGSRLYKAIFQTPLRQLPGLAWAGKRELNPCTRGFPPRRRRQPRRLPSGLHPAVPPTRRTLTRPQLRGARNPRAIRPPQPRKAYRAMPKKRTYTSQAAPGIEGDEAISTEGVSFDLDGVEFTCHGQMDANDLVELAPLLDAGEGQWLDPAALAAVGHFYETVMGRATWALFQAHRRRHHTPPSVIAQIMMDLIQEVTQRPPGRPSPSPSGPPTTGDSSPAAPASPASEREVRLPPNQAADPEGIIPREMAMDGDVIVAPAPDQPGPDPLAGKVRTVNLSRPGAQVRDPTPDEQKAMAQAAAGG